ncbi:MAG: hypothetical protein EAX95_04405 [Candidatus Thorarchaeota archaeon]|nr:hypothetical protein [Candidatus Thorarchaeota archaeon]
MARRVAPFLLALGILILLGSSAVAVSNQDLFWGVEEDDRHGYSFRYEDYINQEYSLRHDFFFIVDSLPDIPASILNVTPMDFAAFPVLDYFYSNGTEADYWYAHLPPMIVPVGNWTLWTSLFEAMEPDNPLTEIAVQVEDESSTWSYVYSSTTDLHSEMGQASYDKETGILADFLWSGYSEGEKYFEYEVHLLGRGLTPEIIIAIVGGGAVLALVIILAIRRKA